MNYVDYLNSRGISHFLCDGVRGDNKHIYYPIDIISSKVYRGWVIRDLDSKKYTTKIPRINSKCVCFFNLLESIRSNLPFVFACEGIEDALSVWAVHKSSVALMGFSIPRILILLLLFEKVYWITDQDYAGDTFVKNFIKTDINAVIKSKLQILRLGRYKDFNEFWVRDRPGAEHFLKSITS